MRGAKGLGIGLTNKRGPTSLAEALLNEAVFLNDLPRTFTRASTAVDPVTKCTVASGAPRRRAFRMPGRTWFGDFIEGARTNKLTGTLSERFDLWSQSVVTTAYAAANAVDGTPTGTVLTDASGASFGNVNTTIVIPNDSSTYVADVFVKKTSGGVAPIFAINVGLSGGTPVSGAIRVNTDTGAMPYGTTAGCFVMDEGSHWRVVCKVTNNTSGNTSLMFSIYPAAAAAGGLIDSAAATGSATICWAMVEAAATPSSYVPSVVGTRAADSLSVDLSALTDTRTNLLTFSEQFDNAIWADVSTGVTTKTANATTDPNGNGYADLLVGNNVNTWIAQQYTNVPASFQGKTFTFAIWLKSDAPNTVDLKHNVGGGVNTSLTVNVTTSWQRFSFTRVMTAAEAGTQYRVGMNIGSAKNIYAWGASLVFGTDAGTYLPTAATAFATPPTGLSIDHGTLLVLVVPYGATWGTVDAATPRALRSGSDIIMLGGFSDGVTQRNDSGGVQGSGPIALSGGGVESRAFVLVYDATSIRQYMNGAAIGSVDTTLTAPFTTVTDLFLGSNSGVTQHLGGHVAAWYVPRALAPAEVTALQNNLPQAA